jgi:hypothetical protein
MAGALHTESEFGDCGCWCELCSWIFFLASILTSAGTRGCPVCVSERAGPVFLLLYAKHGCDSNDNVFMPAN